MTPRLAALAAIGVLAFAGTASAQTPPPKMGGMPDHAQMQARMGERRAQMDKDMHTILRLRPDQETAWRTFRDAVHPPGGHGMMALEPPAGAQTTPQRLDMMSKRSADHQDRRAKVAAATRTFYAALSPDQQAVFDALQRMRGPGKMGRHHGGPPMMGHGMMGRGGPGGDGPSR